MRPQQQQYRKPNQHSTKILNLKIRADFSINQYIPNKDRKITNNTH